MATINFSNVEAEMNGAKGDYFFVKRDENDTVQISLVTKQGKGRRKPLKIRHITQEDFNKLICSMRRALNRVHEEKVQEVVPEFDFTAWTKELLAT